MWRTEFWFLNVIEGLIGIKTFGGRDGKDNEFVLGKVELEMLPQDNYGGDHVKLSGSSLH